MKRSENSSPPLARRGVAGAIAAALITVFGMLLATSVPQTNAGFSGSDSNSSTWSSTVNPPTSALGLGLGSVATVFASAIHDGVLYIGGDFVTINGATRNRLAAFNLSDGSLLSWNPNANGIVRALAIDGGVVYAGGDFTVVNGTTSRNYAAAFPTAGNGSTALAWDPNFGGVVRAMVVDGTGSNVYVGGDFTTVAAGATTRRYAAAIPTAPNAATATSWNPNLNGAVRAITLSGTNVILGGSFTTASLSNTTRNYAASFRASNGTLNSWNPNPNNVVNALLTASDTGRIYLGGTFTTVAGNSRSRLASVDPTSAAVTTWNPSSANIVNALAYDSANQIVYIGGSFSGAVGSQSRNRVAAVSSTTGIGLGWAPEADNTVWTLTFDTVTSQVAIGGAFAFIGKRESLGITVVSAAVFSAVATVGDLSLDTGATGSIRAMARLGDIVYLGGDFTWISGQYRQHLAAIDLSTGSLTSWAPRVDGLVSALAVNPSTGIVYAGGAFNYSDASIRNRLAAFDSSGVLQDWAPSSDNSVLALAGDWANGVIYAGGAFSNIGASARTRLTAITLDTGEATTFNGLIASGQVNSLALDSTNRRLYAGGSWTTTVQTVTRPYAAAFDLNGASPTSNLLPWAPAPNAAVNVLTLSTDRSVVYLGGAFTTLSSGAASRVYLGAVAFDTGTPTSWAPTLNQVVNAIAIDPTRGTVLITGAFTSINGSTTNQRLAALDPASGTPTAWKATVSNTGYAVVMGRTDSEVIAGGSFTTVTPVSTAFTRIGVAVLTGDTISVPTLGALSLVPSNAAGAVNASVVVGTTLYIGGTFTYVGGAARNRLAAIDLATNTLLPWNPNLNGTVNALAYDATNDVIYAGGSFTTVGAASRAYLAALPAGPSVASPAALSWDPKVSGGSVSALAISTDTLYIAGAFTAVNTSTARNRAAALPLHPASPTATTWNPNLNGNASAIALDATNGVVYVGGAFTTVNGATGRNRAAAFAAVGTGTATTWDPDVNSTVNAIAVDPIGGFVYLGGAFTTANTTVGSVTRNRAAAFPLSGVTATASNWNPNASSTVSALFIDSDNQLIYLGGAFSTVNGLARTRAAAVVMDDLGSVLPWAPNPSSNVNAFVINASNGEVIMGGTFTKISFFERGGLGNVSGALAVEPPTYSLTDTVMAGSASAVINASAIVGDRLYVAGDFATAGSQVRRRLAAFDLSTMALRPDFAGVGTATAVTTIAVSPDRGRVYVGGGFTQSPSVDTGLMTVSRLVSFSLGATTTLQSWAPAPNATVSALALAGDGTLYAGGSFTTIGGVSRSYLAALSTTSNSGSPAVWAPNANAAVVALALDEPRGLLYVGGNFTTIAGVSRTRLAALSLATEVLSASTTWAPDANGTVRSIAVAPNDGTVYAVGDFTSVNAMAPVTRARAAAWRSDGTLTAFDPNLTGTSTFAVAVEPGAGEVYIGGDFTAAAGNASITRLGRFDMTTGAAVAWSSGLSSTVMTIRISVPYKRVLAGGNSLTAGAVTVSGGAVY